jgi:LmbE family N-acetylglucosaminyl deacetylase
MATLLFFHAHPDDEAIATGGTIARASRAGHRVVLVFATRGEHGEVADGFLDPGETLADRRGRECDAAAEVLGAHRVEFLGYVDSGMVGTPENHLPGSFWGAEVEEAASRLARLLTEESVDVLTVYDSDGVYGHPDHIQVHRVGVRAAEMAGTPHVLESTMNRDHLRSVVAEALANGEMPPEDAPDLDGDDATFGRPESAITTFVDVEDLVGLKRAAMAAHASQIAETSFFLTMSDEAFRASFGTEWYIRRGAPRGHREDDVLAGLDGG